MFYNQGYAGNMAARRYAAVHSGSRTEGATPHALVKILFDELLIAMEAAALAERIASGDLEQGELSVALEDLDRLVNDNPVDFPEDMRPSLTEDIQSARMAMESEDSEALQEAAASIQATLSGSDAVSTAS